jgi:hypothetical protein
VSSRGGQPADFSTLEGLQRIVTKEDEDMNLLEKLFKTSDVKRSAGLVSELAKHEAKAPAMLAEFKKADEKAREIATRFNAARTWGSPETVVVHEEFLAVCRRRDGIKIVFANERQRLMGDIEGLTWPASNAFRACCLTWLGQIMQARKAEVIDRVYDGSLDKYVASVRSNSRIVKEAREFVQAAMSEIGGMRLCPLAEIQNRIGELEKGFAKFDFDQLETDGVSSDLAGDLGPVREPAKNQDLAQIGPGPSSSGSWTLNRIGRTALD